MTELQFDRLISAIRWIGWTLLIGFTVLAVYGCKYELTEPEKLMIQSRFDTMYQLAQIPRPPPTVYFVTDRDFMLAGMVNCTNWSIGLNYRQAVSNLVFVLDKVIPHEYGHLMSCYYRGSVGENPHDDWWKQAVIRLGGDPGYI